MSAIIESIKLFFETNSRSSVALFVSVIAGCFIVFQLIRFLVLRFIKKSSVSKSSKNKKHTSFYLYPFIALLPYLSVIIGFEVFQKLLILGDSHIGIFKVIESSFGGFSLLAFVNSLFKVFAFRSIETEKRTLTKHFFLQFKNEKLARELKLVMALIVAAIIIVSLRFNIPEAASDSLLVQLLLVCLVLLIAIVLIISFNKIIKYFVSVLEKNDKTIRLSIILKSLILPVYFLIIAAVVLLSIDILDFPEKISNVLKTSAKVFAVVSVVLFLYKAADILGSKIIKYSEQDSNKLEKTFMQMVRMVVRAFIIMFGSIYIFQIISGKSLTAIFAGLGIGGVAVALASQDTLKNFFGSFMVVMDKPFKVGERVQVAGYDGMIETIGIRSTKLRTLTGNLVAIPNDKLAAESIENVGRRPSIRRTFDITVTYSTSRQKMQEALEVVRGLLADREELDPDNPPRVYFSDFNADSLNIKVYYWFIPPDYWKFMEFNEKINLEIFSEFEKRGIEFAFPTVTNYISQEQPFKVENIEGRENEDK